MSAPYALIESYRKTIEKIRRSGSCWARSRPGDSVCSYKTYDKETIQNRINELNDQVEDLLDQVEDLPDQQ